MRNPGAPACCATSARDPPRSRESDATCTCSATCNTRATFCCRLERKAHVFHLLCSLLCAVEQAEGYRPTIEAIFRQLTLCGELNTTPAAAVQSRRLHTLLRCSRACAWSEKSTPESRGRVERNKREPDEHCRLCTDESRQTTSEGVPISSFLSPM